MGFITNGYSIANISPSEYDWLSDCIGMPHPYESTTPTRSTRTHQFRWLSDSSSTKLVINPTASCSFKNLVLTETKNDITVRYCFGPDGATREIATLTALRQYELADLL
ncbi:MAG: hypothetical protein Q7K43_04870 [Candidatus Woesearchaeota archaeon]|nr:hypothetical protein [Candidatus Woesearchaeota archaeon]